MVSMSGQLILTKRFRAPDFLVPLSVLTIDHYILNLQSVRLFLVH